MEGENWLRGVVFELIHKNKSISLVRKIVDALVKDHSEGKTPGV